MSTDKQTQVQSTVEALSVYDTLKLALEALEFDGFTPEDATHRYYTTKAIAAIREALASEASEQPAQQEPVAWMIWTHGPVNVFMNKDEANMEFDRLNHAYPEPTRMLVPLYTSPPASNPLTDEEIILIVAECASSHQHTDIHFARAIEAKLKEKNGF